MKTTAVSHLVAVSLPLQGFAYRPAFGASHAKRIAAGLRGYYRNAVTPRKVIITAL